MFRSISAPGPKEAPLRTILAAMFIAASTAGADAAFLDGNKLRDWCSSAEGGNQGACLGYVLGVADMLSTHGGLRGGACIPNIEATQAVSTVRTHLQRHPPADGAAASDLVVKALAEAFPCR